MNRVQELFWLIGEAVRSADRHLGLLQLEVKKLQDEHQKREAEHPGQPVGWGNEAEDKFVGEE